MTGLIVASFGTLDDAERARTIDAIERELIAAFPSLNVKSALTANFMRRKLMARGLKIFSIEERIAELRAEGVDEIIILPTHLTPGEEFENKILPFAADDVRVLPPMWTTDCSTAFDRRALEVVIDCFQRADDEALVLIGHGSPHRHNPVYENLQRLDESIHIGVIEPTDRPNYDDVLERLRAIEAKKILLAPLLLTGGAHASDDIADHWFNRLKADGLKVRVSTDGLGTFAAFRRLYIDRLHLFGF